MDTNFIKLIEEGNNVEAQTILDEALTDRAADFLVEKRKQIVAKTFGKTKVKKASGKDEKAILKASQRKAVKDKMGKLKKVKK